jgi:pyruvate dehydrogenase E1 component alpha subunit
LLARCVRPEGHFLGDPLLRIVRRPGDELRDRVGPLLRASTATGTGVTQRAASLGEIAKILGRAARMGGGRSDPLPRLRRRLQAPEQDVARLEEKVNAEVATAVRDALAEAETRP